MRIDNNAGCGVASCPVDLGPNCKPFPPIHVPQTNWIFHVFSSSRSIRLGGTIRLNWLPSWMQKRMLRQPRRWPPYVLSLDHYRFYPISRLTYTLTSLQRILLTAARVNSTPLRHAHRPALNFIPTSRTTAPMLMHMPLTKAAVLRSGSALYLQTQITRSRSVPLPNE